MTLFAEKFKCLGLCSRYPGYDNRKVIHNAFLKGYVRCTTCECYFYKFDLSITHCPCCNIKIRRKYRALANQRQEMVKWI